MKKFKFSLIFAAALAIIALVFISCPPLEEDGFGFTFKYEGPLDMNMWFKILDDISSDGRYITLDLKECTYVPDNLFGGLVEVTVEDLNGVEHTYIAFDAFSPVRWGKDRVMSIILPDEAQMIKQAQDDQDIFFNFGDESEDEKEVIIWSAFRHFKNLRSVTAANVTLIGNYAFLDCENLKEVNIPRAGQMGSGSNVDIGHFAFKGCTSLTTVTFNSAAVIGSYAFNECVNLKTINFPVAAAIMQNAFEGCKSLTEIRFEAAVEIGSEAFKDCEKLKKVYFDANPDSASGIFINFGDASFSGCGSLQLIDIRPAWKVFFCENSFENTGKTLDIYLLDSGSGHEQSQDILGSGENVTLEKINIYAVNLSSIEDGSGIASFIKSRYPDIEVNVVEISM